MERETEAKEQDPNYPGVLAPPTDIASELHPTSIRDVGEKGARVGDYAVTISFR